MQFPTRSATQTLKRLGKKPFDLTAPGHLTPERIAACVVQACGFKLAYATQRVDDEVMDALHLLAKESHCLDKMHAMQSGAILNKIEGVKSEERSVLHTAMRDLFKEPSPAKAAKEATELERIEIEKLKVWLKKVDHEGRFKNLVMVGIGGSNLGPEAAYHALEYLRKRGRKAYFIANVDPDETIRVLNEINLSETLVVIVSKSGSTMETATNEEFLRRKFTQAGLTARDHFVAITGKGSPLDLPEQFSACFYSWDFVGGRFCTTAIYGAVILSFTLGFDPFMQFIEGASDMDKVALSPDTKKNIPLTLALLSVWNHNFLGYPTVAIIPYSSALQRFPAHIQQVEMESNGKHIDKHGSRLDFETGMVIWGEPGNNAQHSFFQLIHQGTQIIPLELIGFKESQYGDDAVIEGTTGQEKLLSNLIAQSLALALGKEDANPNKEFTGNRPSTLLIAEKLTPYAMGALFAIYEHRVAFEGFIWDINSFDQEGVQLGKVLANRVLALFKEKRAGGKKTADFPLASAYIDLL